MSRGELLLCVVGFEVVLDGLKGIVFVDGLAFDLVEVDLIDIVVGDVRCAGPAELFGGGAFELHHEIFEDSLVGEVADSVLFGLCGEISCVMPGPPFSVIA